jgi:hypothetical protein
MSNDEVPIDTTHRSRAGHYEILGETYAKFEFFENGWNPYSRFLDVGKTDLILRRTAANSGIIYREIQVKYGKLYDVGSKWEQKLFDMTSWRFFSEDEFVDLINRPDFFIAYVLAHDIGYRGDLFIFPVKDFVELICSAIPVGSRPGWRKVYLSRLSADHITWILRRQNKFDRISAESAVDVTKYRRNFACLR